MQMTQVTSSCVHVVLKMGSNGSKVRIQLIVSNEWYCANVTFLVLIMCYSYIKCYNWGMLGAGSRV